MPPREEIEQRDMVDFETDWNFLAFKEIYKKLLSTLPTNSTLSTLPTLSTTCDYFDFKEITQPTIDRLGFRNVDFAIAELIAIIFMPLCVCK